MCGSWTHRFKDMEEAVDFIKRIHNHPFTSDEAIKEWIHKITKGNIEAIHGFSCDRGGAYSPDPKNTKYCLYYLKSR